MKMHRFLFIISVLGILAGTITSCASARNGRKCDGRKATKTPMGNM